MTLRPFVHIQIDKTFHQADLLHECQMRGIFVHPGETCVQMRGHLAATPSPSDPEAGTGAALRAAHNSQWVTEIQQVFRLRRSITARSLGGSQGVYMAEMPATALPVAALGPAGLQTVAELAAAHSGRAVQLRAGQKRPSSTSTTSTGCAGSRIGPAGSEMGGDEVKVEEFEGTYSCVVCSESVRGGEALHCAQCSSNPVHLSCVLGSPFAETCSQCSGRTMQPWPPGRVDCASSDPVTSEDMIDLVAEDTGCGKSGRPDKNAATSGAVMASSSPGQTSDDRGFAGMAAGVARNLSLFSATMSRFSTTLVGRVSRAF